MIHSTRTAVHEITLGKRDRAIWFPSRRAVPTQIRGDLRACIPGWPACIGAIAVLDESDRIDAWIAYGPWYGLEGTWLEVHAWSREDNERRLPRNRAVFAGTLALAQLIGADGIVIDVDARRLHVLCMARKLGFEHQQTIDREGDRWEILALPRTRCTAPILGGVAPRERKLNPAALFMAR